MRLPIQLHLAIMVFCALSAQANVPEEIPVIQCYYLDGKLAVEPYADSLVWLNGVRQSTRGDAPPEILMKQGDCLTVGLPDSFYSYRLDKLTPECAFITRARRSLIREAMAIPSPGTFPREATPWRIHPGRLEWTDHDELTDLRAAFVQVDFGYHHLETHAGKPSRTK